MDDRLFLESILVGDNPVSMIRDNSDRLFLIIPELKRIVKFPHNHPHHHLDVWEHTLLAISKSVDDFDVRLTLLLHDIGKSFCYQDEDVRHFRGHAEYSSLLSRDILKRIGYSDEYTEYICSLIALHDTPIGQDRIKEDKDFCLKLYNVQIGDALAHHPDKLEKRIAYLERVNKLFLEDIVK